MFARNLLFLLLLLLPRHAWSQPLTYSARGYVSGLGGISVSRACSPTSPDVVLQHRHESVLQWGSDLRLHADVRSRWLTGPSIAPYPEIGHTLTQDAGLTDLNLLWTHRRHHVVHSHIDRLHASYFGDPIEVHAGRQRINWGRTMVWNPNDLFNPYAWLDFDYPERGGTDALRVVLPWGYAGGMEAAMSRGRVPRETTAAVLLRTSFAPHEVQFLAGSYQRTPVLGAGWAGNVGGTALSGEATVFFEDEPFLTATFGASYMTLRGVFATAEVLYNGAPRDLGSAVFAAPRPDRPFFSDTGLFLSASTQATPLLSLSMAVLTSATDNLRVWMPRATVSLSENWDASLILQHVEGRLSAPIPNPTSVFVRIQRSYATR